MKQINFENGIYFDEKGEIQKTKCYIIYGSPASGKTTYVKKNMQSGDIVVDLDYIKQAISLEEKLETPDSLLPVALYLRECLYDLIEKRQVSSKNIWIVAGLPVKSEREKLRFRLGAELIFMNTTYEECIKRAMKDKERKDKKKAIEVIDKWFKIYEA